MQLCPGRHEPQLPDAKAAFDDLDLVDPDLRLPVGVWGFSSGPWRTRTSNLGIKSPLLYQLS